MRFSTAERQILNGSPPAMTVADEKRIRSATRLLIQRSRGPEAGVDVQYVFDLLSYLQPEARAIVDDEAARTLAELIGST
jgi:hypothetical protein